VFHFVFLFYISKKKQQKREVTKKGEANNTPPSLTNQPT
jgi:hypothetical protein